MNNQLSLDGLDGQEVEAMQAIADRLLLGRRMYGVLNVMDGRDWAKEGVDELLDATIYFTLQAMLSATRVARRSAPWVPESDRETIVIGWRDGACKAGMDPNLVDVNAYRYGYTRGKHARENFEAELLVGGS